MTKRSMLAAVLLAAVVAGPAGAEDPEPTPPPAAPAPAEAPDAGDLEVHLTQLAEARREVLRAERELDPATAALARASRDRGASVAEQARLAQRQERARDAFDAARRRVPELVAQARAAGLSASAARRWEHSLYGD